MHLHDDYRPPDNRSNGNVFVPDLVIIIACNNQSQALQILFEMLWSYHNILHISIHIYYII